LWKKGETSGQLQKVIRIRTDCDQDVVVLDVEVQGDGAACHTGRATCFYRAVNEDGSLVSIDDERLIDPGEVYGKS
jgi:phosphoribosyl-AMP cyclohydrolase